MSASTQNQALAALLFLYRTVLGGDVGNLEGVIRARTRPRLPVVLTVREVRAVLGHLGGAEALVAQLLYGSGLRLMEALDHGALRQGGQRPPHGAALQLGGAAEQALAGRETCAPGRSGGGLGRCGAAPCVGEEIPQCSTVMGLAVAVSPVPPLARSSPEQ